jgi:hypothetical protein
MPAVHLSTHRPVGYRDARRALRNLGGRLFNDRLTLHSHLGPLEVGRSVSIETEEMLETTHPILSCTIPLRIHATEGEELFPVFEGEFEVVATHHGSIEAALEGNYRPPAGWLGHLVDTLGLHTLAERSLRDFFEHAVDRIESQATAQT